MSGYQIFESTPVDEFAQTRTPGVNPPVIARLPDLDINTYACESDDYTRTARKSTRRLSVPKVAMALTAAATVLFAGWIIFGDSQSSEQGSWQPTPPAASAPEAPLWKAESEVKTAAIKLDEVAPQWPANKSSATKLEEATEKSRTDTIAQKSDQDVLQVAQKPEISEKPSGVDIRPRVAANRPLAITTPVPPEKPVEDVRDWSTLNENEYYWAVRQRSVGTVNARKPRHDNKTAESNNQSAPYQDLAVQKAGGGAMPIYNTAKRPSTGYRDSDPSARHTANNPTRTQSPHQKTAPAARLNGVIETPNARMY